MERKTIENEEEFLRQKSVEINFEKDNCDDYISKLREFCCNNAVYALAPVQIGIPKRIIYLRNTTQNMDNNNNPEYNEEQIYINPLIISQKGCTRFLERCASCMDYVGTVERPYSIDVIYYDVKGKKKKETISGFKTTIFCHEYDHLNGILHIDLANDVRKMTYEETREYREKHPYQIIAMEDN